MGPTTCVSCAGESSFASKALAGLTPEEELGAAPTACPCFCAAPRLGRDSIKRAFTPPGEEGHLGLGSNATFEVRQGRVKAAGYRRAGWAMGAWNGQAHGLGAAPLAADCSEV